MLESLCGKAKGHRGRLNANGTTSTHDSRQIRDDTNQHRHQSSLNDLLAFRGLKPSRSTNFEDEFGSCSAGISRRFQWSLANGSAGSDTSPAPIQDWPHSQHVCDAIRVPLGIPHSRSFSGYGPNSITMDNLRSRSPTFLTESGTKDVSANGDGNLGPATPRHSASIPSPTSSRSPSDFQNANSATLNIPRQSAVSVSSAFLSLPPSLSQQSSLKLTPVQKAALQNTWRILKDNSAERIAEKIFQRLISLQPKVKDVFYKAAFLTIFTRSHAITTYRDHSRLLVHVINDLVTRMDKCESLMKELRECGMKHVFLKQSGFKADVWEKFGEAAIEVINEQECVKSNLEAVKAWTILVASVTDEMRHGFETAVRRRSYTSERPKSACD